jgi:transketolase
VMYDNSEEFPVGGFKVHTSKIPNSKFQIPNSKIIIISAGVTLFEAIKAQEELAKENINVTVIDLYSIKPIDEKKLREFVYTNMIEKDSTIQIVTVEDHWFDGGLGDAVLNVFPKDVKVQVHKLAVTQMPRSGKPAQLLDYEGISCKGIVQKVKSLVK